MSEKKISHEKNNLLSWLSFLPTLIIVLITLILGIFPALIITFSDKIRYPVEIDVWEPSVWMFPVLISSTISFAIIILYQKNKLPHMLTSLFKFILNFEISKRITFVLFVVLIGIYAIFNVEEIFLDEPFADFERAVKESLETWSFDDLRLHAKLIPIFFGYLSMELFGSYRAFPFIASILCLFLTYLITVQIAKKRFAGIIALVIVLQSGNFLLFDTTITYPNFWIMFYLFSIYLIFKISYLSPIAFIPAVYAQNLSLGLFLITIPFIALLDLPKRKKILVLSSYLVIIIVAIVLISTQTIPLFTHVSFDTSSYDFTKVLNAFAIILSQFRYDIVIVVFLLPLVVCLFLTSKKGNSNANSLLILIGGVILMTVFIPTLTGLGNTPYRILPLVFFFAIGVGTLLSKKINLQDESLSSKL